MSKIEVNTVAPQCGTTLTLGESGDTVTLGAGASQSGFGRTGTVDWQTSIKTATFTAASGEGYFCNTSGGAFTVNLPSSPSVGDIVALKDYSGTFGTNNLTIGRGGSNLGGNAGDSIRSTNFESLTLVYADATKGWIAVEEGTGNVGERYIEATGGTETTCGDYKIHTFTGPGTFTVCSVSSSSAENVVSYVVGAGGASAGGDSGGGGGAGGFREYKNSSDPYTASPLNGNPGGTAVTVTATSYPIIVGGGGAATADAPNCSSSKGNAGSNSTFSTITSTGGGGGGTHPGSTPSPGDSGLPGGSGGGARNPGSSGGAGNTPPVSPPQGNPGGPSIGGGGGAGAAGGCYTGPGCAGTAGNGGAGVTSLITGTPVGRAGGGASGYGSPTPGRGGSATDGGGAGESGTSRGTCGTANTGGGGGGSGDNLGGAAGGSGIVIIRYKFQ